MEFFPEVYQGESDPFVFISYSHSDEALVYQDLEQFEKHQVRYWCDCGIDPGEEWDRRVRAKIRQPNCSGAIFYLSARALSSEAILKEISFWAEKEREKMPAQERAEEEASSENDRHFAVLLEHHRVANLLSEALKQDGRMVMNKLSTIQEMFGRHRVFIRLPYPTSSGCGIFAQRADCTGTGKRTALPAAAHIARCGSAQTVRRCHPERSAAESKDPSSRFRFGLLEAERTDSSLRSE